MNDPVKDCESNKMLKSSATQELPLNTVAEKTTYALTRLGSTTLLALTVGTERDNQPLEWALDRSEPTEEQAKRLDVTVELLASFPASEDDAESMMVRTWFTGTNVFVDDKTISPAEAVREGYFDEARLSCRKMANDDSWW